MWKHIPRVMFLTSSGGAAASPPQSQSTVSRTASQSCGRSTPDLRNESCIHKSDRQTQSLDEIRSFTMHFSTECGPRRSHEVIFTSEIFWLWNSKPLCSLFALCLKFFWSIINCFDQDKKKVVGLNILSLLFLSLSDDVNPLHANYSQLTDDVI